MFYPLFKQNNFPKEIPLQINVPSNQIEAKTDIKEDKLEENEEEDKKVEKNSAVLLINNSKSDVKPNIKNKMEDEKVLITGDDILIEYVQRLVSALKSIQESILKCNWIYAINKFICHNVWHCADNRRSDKSLIYQRLETRLI